jgi:hypothetical protein
MDKRLGHISAAIGTETTGSIWNLFTGKSTHEKRNNTKWNKEQKSFEERLDRSRGFNHLRLLIHLFEANQHAENFCGKRSSIGFTNSGLIDYPGKITAKFSLYSVLEQPWQEV